jgi:putative hemolysin
VNFLVLPKEGLDLSWQMPASDFFTTGSAASFLSAAQAKLRPEASKAANNKWWVVRGVMSRLL